jgi:uncharacterized cupredoxin-like copper-binding protein
MVKNMSKSIYITTFVFFLNFFVSFHCFPKGDLSRQDPIEIKVFMKGINGKGHFFEPSTLNFETGKLYKMILINNSDSKHYFASNSFSKAIFTRKIQVLKNQKKISEIKGVISEVEVFPDNQIEWWFIPIQTGSFDDLICHIEDKVANKKHEDMGMRGKIIIK